MLVLTRREGESIFIGAHTSVTVLGMLGTQVRLGIDTPKGVPVLRNEIFEKELRRRKETGETIFPSFYRVWSKAERTISGYALELPATDSPRYEYEPIDKPSDLTLDDRNLDIFMYSSEGEAVALATGLKLGANSDEAGVVYARKGGYWIVLVDYMIPDWHDRAERIRLVDMTIYRHEATTNES